MIPICLVTGFLGSGKTTLLRRMIQQHRDRRIAYLVNEFASIDVDGGLLAGVADNEDPPDVVPIPGGSIFCKCLVATFLDHLSSIANRHETQPLDGVVIEASGAADPSVVQQMLSETKLDRSLSLASIVNVVDPGSFLKLIHTLPNIRAQAAAADLTILNKTDLYDEAMVDETERVLHECNPTGARRRAVSCEVDFEPFPEPPMRKLIGELASCQDPHFQKVSATFTGEVDPDAFASAVASLRDVLYRAKGHVPTTRGVRFLDLTTGSMSFEPAEPAAASGVAVILRKGEAQRVIDALRGVTHVEAEETFAPTTVPLRREH